MGSPSFIDREEQDTNAVVDKWSPPHSAWSENITKCTRSSNTGVYIFKLPAMLMFFMMLAHVWVEVILFEGEHSYVNTCIHCKSYRFWTTGLKLP